MTKQKLIVSFTSYPARIETLPLMLDSLYAQSIQPDKILLWLAEDQFPKRADDLPERIMDDVLAGKLDLRWCDNLGSHKKYFYTMQLFPDDIVILVDDDMIYHPDTIHTLLELHRLDPNAITALRAKLIAMDEYNNFLPYREWIFAAALQQPSMWLMPMNGCGVLYPPHSLDEGVFDKDSIIRTCNYNGIICGDDCWLKAHALLAGTSTLTQPDHAIFQREIPAAQKTAIGKLDVEKQSQFDIIFHELLSKKEFKGKKCVEDVLLDAKKNGDFYDLQSDAFMEQLYRFAISSFRNRLNAVNMQGSIDKWNAYLQYLFSLFTMAMAYGNSDYSTKYIAMMKDLLLQIPIIKELSAEFLHVRALIDSDCILLDSLVPRFRQSKNYMQMLKNWDTFFMDHPACDSLYIQSYTRLLNEVVYYSKKTVNDSLRSDSKEELDKISEKSFLNLSPDIKVKVLEYMADMA